MSILPIRLYGDPILQKKTKPMTELTDHIVKLIMDMFETNKKADGVGLAAPQVGHSVRLFVADLSEIEAEERDGVPLFDQPRSPETHKPLVIINPEVITRESAWTLEEGCLSLPGIREKVERPEKILLRYRDGNFQQQEIKATRMFARVLLHEMDHLDGKLFIDHLGKTRRALLRSKLNTIRRGEIEANYPVVLPANGNPAL
jgi:peptide deformylase